MPGAVLEPAESKNENRCVFPRSDRTLGHPGLGYAEGVKSVRSPAHCQEGCAGSMLCSPETDLLALVKHTQCDSASVYFWPVLALLPLVHDSLRCRSQGTLSKSGTWWPGPPFPLPTGFPKIYT